MTTANDAIIKARFRTTFAAPSVVEVVGNAVVVDVDTVDVDTVGVDSVDADAGRNEKTTAS